MAELQDMVNFELAKRDMNLTPEEEALYKLHLQNLYSAGGVDNPDGSRSTLFQMTVTGPGGRAYLVPRVWNGKILEPKAAIDEVRKLPTGISGFPSYENENAAEQRYQQMHQYMEKDTQRYLQGRGAR